MLKVLNCVPVRIDGHNFFVHHGTFGNFEITLSILRLGDTQKSRHSTGSDTFYNSFKELVRTTLILLQVGKLPRRGTTSACLETRGSMQ